MVILFFYHVCIFLDDLFDFFFNMVGFGGFVSGNFTSLLLYAAFIIILDTLFEFLFNTGGWWFFFLREDHFAPVVCYLLVTSTVCSQCLTSYWSHLQNILSV
jgi:hypothetical protein